MDVTILIPTYRGYDVLGRLLASVAAACPAPGLEWNAIVIDNNSPDNTKGTVEAFQSTSIPRIDYVFEPRAGKCRALNRGLEEATGTFVAFLDHDVVVSPGYFVGLRDTLREHPYNAFGGRVLPHWPGKPPRWVTGERPFRNSRGGVIAHDYGDTPKPYGPEMRLPVGCNFVCRRSVFSTVGLFNVHLGPRPGAQLAGEESDLLLRLRAAGEAILYAPGVAVVHPVDPERLTKAYFRYRLFCDGRTGCRMSLLNFQGPIVLGIPRYLYRHLIEFGARLVAAAGRGDYYDAFDRQLDIYYTLGTIYEFRRMKRRGIRD